MKPFLLLILLFGGSCQSSTRPQKLTAMRPTEETYASFARQRIEASAARLLQSLERVTTLDSRTANDLLLALREWRETLSLFVHVFPSPLDSDPYLELLLEAEQGIILIERAFDDDTVVWWVQHMLRSLKSPESQDYRSELNATYATHRKHLALPLYYWSSVNFIPDLDAGISSNLRDYFMEQRISLRKEMTKVLEHDPFFPDQERELQAVSARARILISLHTKYRLLDEGSMFRKEIQSTQDFCEKALKDLAMHSRLRETKDEGKASILSLKIKKDWQSERARKLSRAQSEHDHQQGRQHP